jgi:ATP-dependent Clp protease ATP-binding subunit ClpB
MEAAGYEDIKSAVMESVTAHFRPEFVNRIDEVVVFHSLGADQIQGIAKIQLAGLNKRLEEQELSLKFSDEAMNKLAKAGFDPVYGARPLKRAIQRWVENPLAQQILSGNYVSGDTILAIVENDQIVFSKES